MEQSNSNHKTSSDSQRPVSNKSSSNRRQRNRRPAKLSSSSFDWAKFTNFKSRYTRDDLEQLFNETKASKRKELLERPDSVGLYPIHWAAINNRPDLIECLIARGSSLSKRCRNSLFANGTPLHLAAMNSSIEAAATLLSKKLELDRNRTWPKSLPAKATDDSAIQKSDKSKSSRPQQDGNKVEDDDDDEFEDNLSLNEMLEARDADGQTPLMRSAAPRSRKWDTIRELLQKNFWSLSGRPAEMALFLICMGADWRLAEPQNGMNLLHLAIMNDYDDIVCLLLVIDKRLIDVATQKPRQKESNNKRARRKPSQDPTKDGFRTIALDSSQDDDDDSAATDSEGKNLSPTRKPLIDASRENADDLIMRGLKPLQLAILYSRVRMISLLWRPRKIEPDKIESDDERRGEKKRRAESKNTNGQEDQSSNNDRELKRHLIKACFSEKDELLKFLKPLLLKGLLALDLVLIALVWAPVYCSSAYFDQDSYDKSHHHQDQQQQQQHGEHHHGQHNHHSQSVLPGLRGGLFFVSYCITVALTLRVILKNPGFLRRHSVHYLSELAKLLEGAPKARDAIASRLGTNREQPAQADSKTTTTTNANDERRPSSPLIKLDDTTSIVVPGSQSKQNDDNEKVQSKPSDTKITTLAMSKQSYGLGGSSAASQVSPEQQMRVLQHGVRQLCHRCQCIRRPRSRHCSFCDHCVQDFDHHCIYLGCCIGRNNRLDFLLAMIALSITSIYGTFLQSVSMRHIGWSRFWHMVAFLWIFKYVIIGSISAFLILRRACLGVTLYEEVRSAGLRQMFGRYGPPEEISKSHASLSTLDGSFWRYLPYDRSIVGGGAGGSRDKPTGGRRGVCRRYMRNLREFANYISPDEYLLTFICTDTPLARSLLTRQSDLRIKQQQMHKLV